MDNLQLVIFTVHNLKISLYCLSQNIEPVKGKEVKWTDSFAYFSQRTSFFDS